MIWISLALGGEAFCETVRVRELSAAVEDAQDAFADQALMLGEMQLDQARSALSCLATPVPPKLLGAFAWLEAESAVLRYSHDAAWPWMQLAQDLGVGPPSHLQGDHPIQRWVGKEAPKGPLEGPAAVFREEGRVRVVVDGQRLDRLRVREFSPHLVQVFDGRVLIDSWWQRGSEFHGEWLEPLVEIPATTKKQGDIAYWQAWIVENPSSQWIDYAKEKLDTLQFQRARSFGGAGLESYLAAGKGRSLEAAKTLLEPMDYDRAVMEGSRRALVEFLESHRRGRFSGDARAQLDRLDWELATEQDTSTAYQRYLDTHPFGRKGALARDRLAGRLLSIGRRSHDLALLRSVGERFPGTVAGARAAAHAREERLVAVTLAGGSNEFLVAALRELGLRVDRLPKQVRGSGEGLAEGTGMLWTHLSSASGRSVGWAELWMPGGTAPVATWRVEELTDDAVREALARELPDLSEWI